MTQTIPVKTSTDEFLLIGRLCELSTYFLTPLKKPEPERTFYNHSSVIREKSSACRYDITFHSDDVFNPKAHREDRNFSKLQGLHIGEEELSKRVPSRTSSIYGHRIVNKGPLETIQRSHARINVVQDEFYRNNGINSESKI
ncbi:Hypothetical predicted protein [Argonauta hians]